MYISDITVSNAMPGKGGEISKVDSNLRREDNALSPHIALIQLT
jgi:hypothetical protein